MLSAEPKYDPYKVLGVGRDATEEEIKAAYRASAKQSHPDAGGDAEDFMAASRAFDLLSDPERRARYDETGQIDEGVADETTQVAYEIIGQALLAFIRDDAEPTHRDLMSEMRFALRLEITRMRETLSGPRRAADRAKRMEMRIRKKSGENILARMLAKHAEDSEKTIRTIEKNIAHRERAIEIMADYQFTFDQILQVTVETKSEEVNPQSFPFGKILVDD